MANDMSPSIGRLFELTAFLEGSVTAIGLFEDRFGRIRRRFRVDMEGRWQGSEFVVDEQFTYDDGEKETRVWTIRPEGGGRFSAETADCVGEAVGTCSTDQTTMRYKFRLRLKERDLVVDFDDRVYRMDDHRAINRASVRKWGIRLGEVTIYFERSGAPALAAAA